MNNVLRIAVFTVLALAVASGTAMARGTFLSNWQTAYPDSSSDDNVIDGTGASCQLCHRDSNGGDGWNGYGWAMRERLNAGDSRDEAIANIEPLDSDQDIAGSYTNLEEIDGDTQPGWTDGANNTIYFKDGTTQTGQSAPAAILGNLDPGVVCFGP